MPRLPITITDSQRDAIYKQTINHLAGLNDVWMALDRNDYKDAAHLGPMFEADLRLLRDLGWSPHDDRERIELTMSYEDLERIMRRLRDEAKNGAGDTEERRAKEEFEQ